MIGAKNISETLSILAHMPNSIFQGCLGKEMKQDEKERDSNSRLLDLNTSSSADHSTSLKWCLFTFEMKKVAMFPHMYVKILALETYWGFPVCIYLFAFDLFGGVFLSSVQGRVPWDHSHQFFGAFLVGNLF